jgi:hypothetical protein
MLELLRHDNGGHGPDPRTAEYNEEHGVLYLFFYILLEGFLKYVA